MSLTLGVAVAHLKASGLKANSMQVLQYIAAYNAAMEFYKLQVSEKNDLYQSPELESSQLDIANV